jgi:UDP-glucose 4-epimerase
MTSLEHTRCLVTGGAGFIGSHITNLLVKDGAGEVIVLDNFTRGRRENLNWAAAHGSVRIVEGDIRDITLLSDLAKGTDVVFHQAAIRITQCAQEPRLAHDVLATGTFNVLEAAVNAKVRKVVAASSASVYGTAGQFPTVEEHHPYANDTVYGAAKTYLEGMCRSFKAMYGLDYVALRYFNVYGPRMDIHGKYTEVMIRWMERIRDGKPPLIFGDGLQTMDLVHVEDIARANIMAARADVTDQVFNVASGTETSLNELAKTMVRVMDADLSIEYAPERAVNPVRRRLASTEKARRLLRFEARVGLEEGLRGLVAWWRSESGRPSTRLRTTDSPLP